MAFSDIQTDSEKLFNWAEVKYPNYFANTPQSSQNTDLYIYRYYPQTDNYLGVKKSDLNVYVKGDVFDGLKKINTLADLIATVDSDTLSDAEELFNRTEELYPEKFSPSNQTTITTDAYFYRYYPSSDTYIGVKRIDLDVYILGDMFGGLQRVDSLNRSLNTDTFQPLFASLNPGGVSIGGSSGAGSCVSIPLIAQDTEYRLNTISGNDSFISDVTHQIVTPTQSKIIVSSQGEDLITEETYSISDNIFSTSNVKTSLTSGGFTTKTDNSFSPAKQAIGGEFCLNQTFTSNYTSVQKIEITIPGLPTNIANQVFNFTDNYTVDAVNESITTAAGTFNTVNFTLVTTENNVSTKSVTWLDTDTGIIVRQESYDANDALESISELQQIK